MSGYLTASLDYWKGLLHFKRRKWEEADACFDAACQKTPDHADSHFKRGLMLMKLRRWRDAFPYLQKAILLDPSKDRWMVQFRDAEKHLEEKDPPEFLVTEQEFLTKIEENPKWAFLYRELARVLRTAGKRWQEVEALRSAVEIDESDYDSHYRMAVALEGMKRHVEAADHFEKAVKLGPATALWFYQLGHVLSVEGHDGPPDTERARVYYRKAVEALTNQESRGLGIGGFHEKYERWNLAVQAYREQLAEAPGDARLHHRLGVCLGRLYQWRSAADSLATAISLDGSVPERHFRLAVARERLDDFGPAADSYQAAIRLSASPPPYWSYRLGYVLEKIGRHSEACDAFEKAVVDAAEDAPTEDAVMDPLGPELSGPEWEKSISHDMTNPDGWLALGKWYESNDRWQDAADAYQQAVLRGPRHNPTWYLLLGKSLRKLGLEEQACAVLRDSRILRRPYGIPGDAFKHDPGLRKVAYYTEYYETLDIEPKTVLYESFHGKVMSCNPYALFLHFLEDPAYADWKHVWAVNDMSVVPDTIKRMKNVILVIRNSDPYMRYLASARLLINNVTFFPYFIRRKEQIYLNTWHGTPWKMLGKDVRQEFLTYGNMTRNFLQCTHILSQNAHTTSAIIRSFDIEGLAHGAIVESGYPRVDLTLNASPVQKAELRKRLGVDPNRKVALYAPTWRGSHAEPDQEVDELLNEISRLRKSDCTVLFRGHTLSGAAGSDINVPDDISTNELLSIVDILITDYSSVAFDFMVTEKPILFFLKDYDEYRNERGLYFGVEELPGEVAYTLDDLCSRFNRVLAGQAPRHPGYDKALEAFCPHEDGAACRRVAELLFSETPPRARVDERRMVLMFGGKFIPNGITSSLTNLLTAVDHGKLRFAIPVEPAQISESPAGVKCFERISGLVQVLPRAGRLSLTPEEKWLVEFFKKNSGIPQSPETEALYRGIYEREFKRLFGESMFDAVVDFEGYNVFWASVLGCVPEGSAQVRAIYQHNDLLGECRKRFPSLEQVFDVYRYFDRLISVSKMTMDLNIDSLAERYAIPAAKFGFAENVLNPEPIRELAAAPLDAEERNAWFSGDCPVFVTIGRLSIEKDHQKLIRAFSAVVRAGRSARLVIVGDGPLMPELKRLVVRLGMDRHIHLAGFRENPFPYAKHADCFVLSSNHEGQPMVLLEAIILGKPIIATDIVGSRGVIEGRSGDLVPNSEEGLVKGITDFLDGRITAKPVDMEAYRRNALDGFYRNTCGID